MNLYVVSDLHIWGEEDPLYHSLLALLRKRAKPGDVVVLAGDIFDLFVGEKEVFLRRYADFMLALSEAGFSGVKLHYIEGNHDFLLQQAFEIVPGLTVHADSFELELEGRRFYFEHGDRVNRKDYGYRVLRAFFRSPVMKGLVKLTPGEWLDRFGKFSSYSSRQSKPLLPADLPKGRLEDLRKIYRSHAAEKLAQGCDFVVMGHCHDLDEMSFRLGERMGQYVNVGFPRAHGSMLSWSPGEEKIGREKLPE